MIKARGLKAVAAMLALATVTLTGCVVAPAPGYYAGGVVTVAPPEPQVEVVGVAPGPGYLWIGGYWNWVGGRHVWVPGRWDIPPRGYHAWVPHRWVAYHGGWRLQAGHWR